MNLKIPRICRQYDKSEPIIRKTYYGWECYHKADGISALGKTPSKAYKAWLKKTIRIEEKNYV